MNYEILGHVGAGIIAIALMPQVVKSWRTKSTKDISLLWNSVLLLGLCLFLVYGFGTGILPVMIFGLIEVLLTLSLLVLKLVYR